MTLHVEAAGLTHRGSARPENEDCIAIGEWLSQENMESARAFRQALYTPFACVLADGMGGHNNGDQASRLVASLLAQRLPGAAPTQIVAALRAVNAELHGHVVQHPTLAGMGSTAVGLSIHGASVAICNVGDSRAYRVEERALVQLSVDDSEDTNWKPGSLFARSGMLTQCFGGGREFSNIEPHLHVEPCLPGKTYLLCSDGLYETLDEEQLLELIGDDLNASVEAIFRTALRFYASDNVSIALLRVAESRGNA